MTTQPILKEDSMTDQAPDNQTNKSQSSGWADDFRDDMHDMRDDLKQGAKDFRQEFRVSTRHRNSGWIWGLLLILAGGLLLLQNVTYFQLHNWWALFILIPSFGSFADAWAHYRDQGRISGRVRSSLLSGFIFACVAAFFLFNLSLGQYWPVLIILAGLAVLVNAMLPE